MVVKDPLLNENQAAEYLGDLSVKTLQRWRWLGRGPEFVKCGSRVFYRQSALEAYIEAGRRHSTSDEGVRA